VISNAATDAANVVGLVFVAAFAPDQGERLGEVEGGSKDSVLMSALVPLQYPTGQASETAVEFAIDPTKFHDAFAADLPPAQAAVMAATQRPIAELAFSEPSGPPAWRSKPAWAVVATGDRRPVPTWSAPWPSAPKPPLPRPRARTCSWCPSPERWLRSS
jgi:hypothetical protein